MPGTNRIYPAETADIKHFVSGINQRNDHYLHAIIEFDGFLNIASLKKALRSTFRALPMLTCRFVRSAEKAWWEEAGWTEDAMIDLIQTDNKEQTIQQQLICKPNELKGPQIHIGVVRTGENDSLAIVLNHMICDGGGIRDYLYLLATCYTTIEQQGDPSVIKMPLADHRSFQQVFEHLSAEQLKTIQETTVCHYPQTEKDHLPLQGDPSHPFVIRHRLAAERFDTIKKHAKQFNATINDALFAAYICAMADYLPVEKIILDCPVNARAYLPTDYQPGFCNLTSNIICAIPTHHGECYEEALTSVKKVMDEQKGSLSPLSVYWDLDQAYMTLPLNDAIKEFPKIYRIPINGMTNIGILDAEKLRFGSATPVNASISGSIKYAPYFQIAVTTFQKSMTFSTNFHGTENDFQFLDHLVTKMIGYFPE
ncbi:hypothetical protein [Sporolactobacillus spathodeae]|uniref:NRPS condensation-like uncharacterized protein n=2 Tax=Sporolactobacillus spathodeae TaxID=1465502 RepID=A0ABS2QB53_9BACL|nr:hypothetical protein [Sporolactobacillus spathodeae]MBM7658197.1 NRPS condensation-like uncharacterized protein [Sporolactobacillus spathodeae]